MTSSDRNQEAAQAFADRFDPPLSVVGAERVNGQPERNAFCASGMVADGEVGITCIVAGNGHLKAYVEFVGARDMAEEVGAKFAKLVEIWNAFVQPEAG